MDKTFTPEKPLVKKVLSEQDLPGYEPSKVVIDTILAYSKALSVRDSKIAGKVEFNLN